MLLKPPKKRLTIMVGEPRQINITLVGLGGTGSFLALHLARLAYTSRTLINLRFIDFDIVEAKNVGRQYFCPADIRHYKAETLAKRMNRAYGMGITYALCRFDADLLPEVRPDSFDLVIGAVDNHFARRAIAKTVEQKYGHLWWLDCGNHHSSGQVLLGNSTGLKLSQLGYCKALPHPAIQSPDLLEAEEEEKEPESCADLVARQQQSLNVNSFIAGLAAEYVRELTQNKLSKYATYFDLAYGNMRSEHIARSESLN